MIRETCRINRKTLNPKYPLAKMKIDFV